MSPTEIAEEQRARSSFLITDALIIAAVPLVGYAIVFSYESGLAAYYHIPLQLITLSITHVLVTTAALVGVIGFLFSLASLGYSTFLGGSSRGPIGQILIEISPLLLLLIGAFYLLGRQVNLVLPVLIVIAVFISLPFFLPLLTQRKIHGYRAKLEAQEHIDSSVESLTSLVIHRVRPLRVMIVVCFFLVLILANVAGEAEAAKRTVFLVDSARHDRVVLRIWGDTVVSRSYDVQNHRLGKELVVQKLSAANPLMLSEETLGKLRP